MTVVTGVCPSAVAFGADSDGIGTIALISGKAWVRKGDISIPTAQAAETTAPSLKFSDQTARELGPNDPIKTGDVIVTSESSYLKIYYKDDSIMDVGPNTSLKVEKFDQQASGSRKILFTLLSGKVRTLVTRSLDGDSSYRVATPTGSMGVHGTEWVTNAYQQNGLYRTDVTVLEGKVMVDMPKVGSDSRETVEHLAITPGKTFSGMGNGGSVAKFSLFKLQAEQVQEITAMIPNIETKRMGSIAVNSPQQPPAQRGPSEGAPAAELAVNAPGARHSGAQPEINAGAGGATDVSFERSQPPQLALQAQPPQQGQHPPQMQQLAVQQPSGQNAGVAEHQQPIQPTLQPQLALQQPQGQQGGAIEGRLSASPALNAGSMQIMKHAGDAAPPIMAFQPGRPPVVSGLIPAGQTAIVNKGPMATLAPAAAPAQVPSVTRGPAVAASVKPSNITIAPPTAGPAAVSSASSAVTAVVRPSTAPAHPAPAPAAPAAAAASNVPTNLSIPAVAGKH